MPKCLEALNGGEEGGRGVRELLREGVCVGGGGGGGGAGGKGK